MYTLVELQLMRQALDIITIVGKDAKVVATLQAKLENDISKELKKGAELEEIIHSKK